RDWSSDVCSSDLNRHFIIERSTNGVDFFAVGQVLSQGNATSRQSYSFNDLIPENVSGNARQLFYRIRQVDLDGKQTISPVISLNERKQSTISVYPNPASKNNLPGVFIPDGEKVRTQVFNNSGQLILKKQLSSGYTIMPLNQNLSGLILIKIIQADGMIQTFKVLME